MQAIKKDLGALDILRQSTECLAFLYEFGYFHGNLKPSKFRIATYSKIHMDKLCGCRQAMKIAQENKNLVARKDQWIAPELAKKDKLSTHPSTHLSWVCLFILCCLKAPIPSKGQTCLAPALLLNIVGKKFPTWEAIETGLEMA